MVGRWKLALASAGCGVVVLVVVSTRLGDREPVYEGHLLSEWILYENIPRSASWETRNEIIWQAGTNTLPWLLKWTQEPPVWRTKLLARYSKLPRGVRVKSVRMLLGERQERLVAAATETFYILGPDASPAIPALVERLKPTCSPATQCRAKLCLANIIPTVEALVGRLDYRGPHMAEIAARGLGRWGLDRPDYVVPALVSCLEKEKWPAVQCAAAVSLGEFGEDARRAVPVLRDKLQDPEPELRAAVRSSLLKIAPEALDEELGPWILVSP